MTTKEELKKMRDNQPTPAEVRGLLEDAREQTLDEIATKAKAMKSPEKGAQARGWNDALDEIILMCGKSPVNEV